MNYLLFDFETTGISFHDKSIPQRAIQLAWIIVNQEGKIIKRDNHMISGNPEINTDFHTNLTTEILDQKGSDPKTVIMLFHKRIARCGDDVVTSPCEDFCEAASDRTCSAENKKRHDGFLLRLEDK